MTALTIDVVVGLAAQAADERAVDLEAVDREAAQVAQRASSRCRSRRAATPTPMRAAPASAATQRSPSSSTTLSVTSRHSRAGSRPLASSASVDGRDQAGLGELAGGDVDADDRSCAVVANRRTACRHASRRTQAPIGTIRPVSSASAMNSAGRQQAALGVLPAHERLDADDPRRSRRRARAGSGRTSSLVRDRLAQVGLDRAGGRRRGRGRPRRTATSGRRRPPWRGTWRRRRRGCRSSASASRVGRERDADAGRR